MKGKKQTNKTNPGVQNVGEDGGGEVSMLK